MSPKSIYNSLIQFQIVRNQCIYLVSPYTWRPEIWLAQQLGSTALRNVLKGISPSLPGHWVTQMGMIARMCLLIYKLLFGRRFIFPFSSRPENILNIVTILPAQHHYRSFPASPSCYTKEKIPSGISVQNLCPTSEILLILLDRTLAVSELHWFIAGSTAVSLELFQNSEGEKSVSQQPLYLYGDLPLPFFSSIFHLP